MMQRHHTFPSDDGMAFSFFDGKVVIHSKMGIKESGIKEAAEFAADILHVIGMMQEDQEEKYESISNQSTDIES